MSQVHSRAEQNSYYNFETLHHARVVKLPTDSTVLIFEDTKRIVVGLFNSPTTITDLKKSHAICIWGV